AEDLAKLPERLVRTYGLGVRLLKGASYLVDPPNVAALAEHMASRQVSRDRGQRLGKLMSARGERLHALSDRRDRHRIGVITDRRGRVRPQAGKTAWAGVCQLTKHRRFAECGKQCFAYRIVGPVLPPACKTTCSGIPRHA